LLINIVRGLISKLEEFIIRFDIIRVNFFTFLEVAFNLELLGISFDGENCLVECVCMASCLNRADDRRD
jgi:hypothetical protein